MALKEVQDLDTWKQCRITKFFSPWQREKQKTKTNLCKNPEKVTFLPPTPALTVCTLLASERGRLFSVSRPQSQTPGFALPSELPERVRQRPECLAEATVGASISKSLSRTLPPARFRAVARPVRGEGAARWGTVRNKPQV